LTVSRKRGLFYIVEVGGWSIKWDGQYITKNLNKLNLLQSRITTTHLGARNKIIHFGSVNIFLKENGSRRPHKSNKVVLTWFHFVPGHKRNKNILSSQNRLSFLHTSCNITKNKLISFGVNPEKIKVIPLGVDLSLFKPCSQEKRQALRKELDIPVGKVVVGSFQKDGVGWGEGLEPKLIKGPDIFVKVVSLLAKHYPIFVLLAGPARGYVQKELKKRNIPYISLGHRTLSEVAEYYHALDMYLITSRIEGGPKAILEGMASAVPVVSTKVGMVGDITTDNRDVLLGEVEDIQGLFQKASQLIENANLMEQLKQGGLKTAQNYSWSKIAQRYYQEIYKHLL